MAEVFLFFLVVLKLTLLFRQVETGSFSFLIRSQSFEQVDLGKQLHSVYFCYAKNLQPGHTTYE